MMRSVLPHASHSSTLASVLQPRALALVLGLLLPLSATAQTPAWPDGVTTFWTPLVTSAGPLSDVSKDAQNERDVVGSSTHPACFVHQDADFQYFRIRLNDTAMKNGTFEPFGWGFLLNTDSNLNTYEFMAVLNGINNPDQVEWRWNQTQNGNNITADTADVEVAAWGVALTSYARQVSAGTNFSGGNGANPPPDEDFFVDFVIPMSTFRNGGNGAPGIPEGTPLRFGCGTASNAQRLDSDPASVLASPATFLDLGSDPVVCTSGGCSCSGGAYACGASCLPCGGGTPFCSSSGTCVQCSTAGDCPAGATCNGAGSCMLAAPTISSPTDGATLVSVTPTLSGTTVAGASVELRVDGTLVATVIADGAGQWNHVSGALSLAAHTLTATASVTDGATTVTSSPASVTFNVAGCATDLDCAGTTPVCAPSGACVRCEVDADCPAGATCNGANACVLVAPSITGPADGSETADGSPTVSGTAPAGTTVTVSVDGSVVGTTTSDGSGSWSFDVPVSLGQGAHTVLAVASSGTAPLGVTSLPSPTVGFTVVECTSSANCAGATPVCDTATDSCVRCLADGDCPAGATCGGNTCALGTPVVLSPAHNATTNDTTPTVSGTGPVGATVRILVDGNEVVTTVVAGDGTWSVEVPVSLSTASHTVAAQATSGAGLTAVTSGVSAANSFFVVSGCLGNGDCAEPTPLCNTGTNTCAQCLGNPDCAPGATCGSGGGCELVAPVVVGPADGSSTQDPAPTVTGTAVPGSTVQVFVDGSLAGTVLTDGSGNWSVELSANLPAGAYVLTAVAQVGSGGGTVTSPSSNANTVTVLAGGCSSSLDCSGGTPVCNTTSNLCVRCTEDSDCPSGATCNGSQTCVLPAPLIAQPAPGAETTDSTPTFSGTAAPGATVTLTLDGNTLGTVVAAGDGSWSFTPGAALPDGQHSVSATATAGSGVTSVTSSPSGASAFTVGQCFSSGDCSGATPACEIATHLCRACVVNGDCPTGAACSGSNVCTLAAPTLSQPVDGTSTLDTTPTFSGTGVPGTTVELFINGSSAGSTLVGAGGTWSLEPLVSLSPGGYTAFAVASSGSAPTGVTSAASPTVGFSVVTGCMLDTDCAAPTPFCDPGSNVCVECVGAQGCATGATCDGSGSCALAAPLIASPADGASTRDPAPTVSGTGVAGATVSVFVDGGLAGTATVDTNGIWSLELPVNLSPGTYALTSVARVGSGPSEVVSATSPVVNVTVIAGGCSSSVDCSGATPVCDTATDLCVRCLGNGDCPTGATCDGSSSQCVLASPVVTSPVDGSSTLNPTPTLAGTGVPGSTVTVFLDGSSAGTAVVDAQGNWTLPLAANLAPGTYVVTAQATVGAGVTAVTSAVGTAVTFTVDPGGCGSSADCGGATPVCLVSTNTCARCAVDMDCPTGASCSGANVCVLAVPTLVSPANGGTTADTTPTFSGTAPPGSTVSVTVDGQVVGTAVASGSGQFEVTVSTPLGAGAHTVTVSASSGSGQLAVASGSSPSSTFTVSSQGADADADGIPDDEELLAGTNPNDADTDDDGVLDGGEPQWDVDSDGDGLINALDPDSDNDGLLDGTELGVTAPPAATDVSQGNFVADQDPLTVTDPLVADTDGDGLEDGVEDLDLDGQLDPGETHPLDPLDDTPAADTDGDGIPDSQEVAMGSSPTDADSDDDGVPDGQEPNAGLDTDGDGLINALDPDSDNDNILDGTELGVSTPGAGTDVSQGNFVPDADPGGTTSPLSADSDGGGMPDGFEDLNHNGRVDTGETDPTVTGDDNVMQDSDGDGIPDLTEGFGDPDGDGVPNLVDLDSDGDGLRDSFEVGSTSGGPTTPVDTDQDGLPDFLDPDSDGDGVPDLIEGGGTQPGSTPPDLDGDGIPDFQDADRDGDGVNDGVDTCPNTFNTRQTDLDGDGVGDDCEADSDGDGVLEADDNCLDIFNPDQADLDQDGIGDVCDPDRDGDGFLDGVGIAGGGGCSAAGSGGLSALVLLGLWVARERRRRRALRCD